MVIAFSISYVIAGTSAMRRGGKFELSSLYGSLLFWSLPAFWIGLILIWVFAVYLKILPVFGTSSFQNLTGIPFGVAVLEHAILPVITLSLMIFGQNYLLLRGSAQQVLKEDYVLTANARGLRPHVVAYRYIMRNSLLPVVALLGYSVASIISSEIIVEAVFGYGGVGDLLIDAVLNRDYPVMEGGFFYITLMVILLGLVGDFLLTRLDPRLR
jgi:peptide/nickel transport system permease protein